MGEGQVSTAGWALILAAAVVLPALPAQGIVYRERWGYLHLENRRFEVLRDLRTAAAADAERLARLLAEPDGGMPWTRIAQASAMLRGVEADDPYVLRTAMSVFVLPEVADPEGRNETCRVTNVSVFLPCVVPLPNELAIDFELRDAAGKVVWQDRIAGELSIEDLRMGRPVVRVPAAELADGSYELTVRTVVDGKSPGPKDPVLQWPMHVLRGYQARCEQALLASRAAGEKLDELPRSLLAGCVSRVTNTYFGEAFEGTSRAIADLERLELALRNVEAGKHVLMGMRGDVPVQFADGGLPCLVRLPGEFGADEKRSGKPLVVFAAASPCFDMATHRPTAPSTRGPAWLAMELPDFGQGAGCDVAFVDSPGEGRDYAPHLVRAVQGIKTVLGTGDRPVVLVCDREAASVAALHAGVVREHVAGLVLVGSGGMTGKTIDALDPLAVRLVPTRGHPGAEALRRSLDYAQQRPAAGTGAGSFARLVEHEPAWPFAVPLLASEIETFAAEVFARGSRKQ